MIAGIKKYTFLVHHRDYTDLLNLLRKAGVVHIIEKRKVDESSPIMDDLNLLKRYKEAIRQLSAFMPVPGRSEQTDDPEKMLYEFESLMKEIEERRQLIEKLKAEASRVAPWGEFDATTLQKLRDSGWGISLFISPQKRFKEEWNENYTLEIINREKSRIYFAVIHRKDEVPDIDADQEKIPERPGTVIYKEIAGHENKIALIETKIRSMAPVWKNALMNGSNSVISKIEYTTVAGQADKYAENNLFILEGWVPDAEENKLNEELQNLDCYSFVSEPGKDEKVPVILVNNKFFSLFEPIGKLFSLPDYRELDLTPFFAPFFMLFFGFCLGDAGYGLFFVIAGFFVKRKVDVKFKPFITLIQYLGAAAVLFGFITGTFFGINLIDTGYTITEQSIISMREEGVPPNVLSDLSRIRGESFKAREDFTVEVVQIIGPDTFTAYKNAILRNADTNFSLLKSFRHLMQDSLNMFYLALILGGIQILFGMILKIINIAKQKGFKYSLSMIGWVLLILTIIIFKGGGALKLFDETRLRPLFNALLIFSGGLIFFLNMPGINIFLRIGRGIWDAYNIITGIFGDLLSYIRLFALGISSSILGFVFNDISSQLLPIPYVGWLLFGILLIVGHTINLFMATLGGFVHPLRLTFVEFYKNAGFKGGGIEYKPFKIKTTNK